MSSYEYRRNPATGNESHRIRFRHAGKNRAVPFHTEAQARSWQSILDTVGPARALELLAAPRPTTTRTVHEQLVHHIEHQTGVTDGTRRRYRHMAANILGPAFDGILLSDLSRDHVAQWVNSQGHRAPKTVANLHGLLSGALRRAVEDGLIPVNPAHRVKLPPKAHDGREMIFLTEPEFMDLLELVKPHWHPLLMLLVGTGIRWGEATALTIGDMNRAAHSARIRQAWKYAESGGPVLGPPKSRKSRRTVAVPEEVFAALEPQVRRRRAAEFVILNPVAGGPVRSGRFHHAVWQPAALAFAESHDGRKPRIHDLRHTFASWAIQRGVSLPVIQRQMGHESITTTIDTYGHLARSDFDPLLSMGAETLGRYEALGGSSMRASEDAEERPRPTR